MTDRELMQMALEALDSDNPYIQVGAAISLRGRLAKPEPEHVMQCSYPKCQATNGCVEACSKAVPPKPEWVGLTDEEIKTLAQLEGANRERTATEMAFAVQAKLKEKNT